ncbi:unnamed protein product, partial [Prorocentrum cordatum]
MLMGGRILLEGVKRVRDVPPHAPRGGGRLALRGHADDHSARLTISDLLCQILVDGTAKRWEYGEIRYGLHNTGITELFLHGDGSATFGLRDRRLLTRERRGRGALHPPQERRVIPRRQEKA